MKDRIIFLPSDAAGSDNVGAFVRAGTDGDLISSTLIGSKEALDVNMVGGADSGIFAEDSIHVSGDNGQFVLAVQTAAQGALGADGDYVPFQVDPEGRLRVIADIDLIGDLVGDDVADSEDPLKVGSRSVFGAVLGGITTTGNKANLISDKYRRVRINDTAAVLVKAAAQNFDFSTEVELTPTAIEGRLKTFVQNLSTARDLYIGATGVLTTTGFQIRRGSTWEFPLGPEVNLFAIGVDATAIDVRTLELA